MKKIRSTSQRGQMYLEAYRRSNNSRLSDCYGRYSTEKGRAERDLIREMNETGGSGFKILSHSHFFFTCGWITADGDLRVETVSNSFLIVDE